MEPRHSLFRERALQEYRQTQEKTVHPRFVPSSVPVLLYILLLVLVFVGIPIWWGEVPVFTNGLGVVLAEKTTSASNNHPMTIMLFLPANHASQVHKGTSTQMSDESSGQQFTGTIEHVNAGIISSDEARKRYMLSDDAVQAIPQSSVAVTIIPTAKSALRLHAGDLVNARVQTGSQRILSLLLSLR